VLKTVKAGLKGAAAKDLVGIENAVAAYCEKPANDKEAKLVRGVGCGGRRMGRGGVGRWGGGPHPHASSLLPFPRSATTWTPSSAR
jgi:hypothetical protein